MRIAEGKPVQGTIAVDAMEAAGSTPKGRRTSGGRMFVETPERHVSPRSPGSLVDALDCQSSGGGRNRPEGRLTSGRRVESRHNPNHRFTAARDAESVPVHASRHRVQSFSHHREGKQ
jgi:hypothetical protein